jgi:hypothetical protein
MRLRMGRRDFRISTSHEQAQWYVDSTARVISSRVLVRMCIHNVSAVMATSGAGDDDTRLRLLATASRDMTVRLVSCGIFRRCAISVLRPLVAQVVDFNPSR